MSRAVPELLSPAGSPEALRAAVENGCDAVYMGGRQYGARHAAVNFAEEELERAIDYCHLRRVKVYLTVNTLYRDDELAALLGFVETACRMGVDGLITQDIGVGTLLARYLPDVPLHASTQMTAHSAADLLFLRDAGYTRVVLAREAPITAVAEMAVVPGIESEVFVHGALCVSYSGQCLFSSLLGGRSGNRGRCAQPCRLRYTLEPTGRTGHLLSPRDVITLNILDEIIQTGVHALKIEGRMRGPDYVAHVTRLYRAALDRAASASTASSPAPAAETIQRLAQAYGRGGEYCEGYFHANSGLFMMNPQGNYDTKQVERPSFPPTEDRNGKEPSNKSAGDRPPARKKLTLTGQAVLRVGLPATLSLSGQGLCITVRGATVEKALNRPVPPDEIMRRLQKTGDSPFAVTLASVEADDAIFMNIKDVNALRRDGLSAFEAVFVATRKRTVPAIPPEAYTADEPAESIDKALTASVFTPAQFAAALAAGVDTVYFETTPENMAYATQMRDEAAARGVALFAALPRVNGPLPALVSSPVVGYLARTWGQLYLLRDNGMETRADYSFNILNRLAASVLARHAAQITLSPELSLCQLGRMSSIVNAEVIVYGRLPLLFTRQCPVGLYAADKDTPSPHCKKSGPSYHPHSRTAPYTLRDRKGKQIPLVTDCANCLCLALNADTLYMADKPEALCTLPQNSLRLMFTTETSEQVTPIIAAYRRALADGIATPVETVGLDRFTRGHFYRGVL